jgi:hypothetical protein
VGFPHCSRNEKLIRAEKWFRRGRKFFQWRIRAVSYVPAALAADSHVPAALAADSN